MLNAQVSSGCAEKRPFFHSQDEAAMFHYRLAIVLLAPLAAAVLLAAWPARAEDDLPATICQTTGWMCLDIRITAIEFFTLDVADRVSSLDPYIEPPVFRPSVACSDVPVSHVDDTPISPAEFADWAQTLIEQQNGALPMLAKPIVGPDSKDDFGFHDETDTRLFARIGLFLPPQQDAVEFPAELTLTGMNGRSGAASEAAKFQIQIPPNTARCTIYWEMSKPQDAGGYDADLFLKGTAKTNFHAQLRTYLKSGS
jgi:hypothetical protein